MAELTYSGQLLRQRAAAHYSGHVPVSGVDPAHAKPAEGPDVFEPEHQAPERPPMDLWQPADVAPHTEMRADPITHWTRLNAPLPMNVPSAIGAIEATRRMVDNHSVVDYRPHLHPQYKHAGEGVSIEYTDGRRPQAAGESVPDSSGYLQMGTNAYDRTNGVTEVYSADAGRYRLGTRIEMYGTYEFHTRQGQDAQLRAYSGLTPAFPVTKPRLDDYAPYTAPSSGTDTWTLNAFQRPSSFALPSETATTDYQLADAPGGLDEFDDGGRL